MSDRIDFDRIDRHLSGESPAARDDQATREVADALRAALSAESSDDWDTARSLAQLQGRMRATASRRRWSWLVAAAAVVIAVAGALVMRTRVPGRPETTTAQAPLAEFRTGVGERRTVRLPDSSTVTLAPASLLRAPATFAGGARMVQLEGEAFFQVTPDSARPFTVEGNQATVRVLGTSFNVRAYADRGGQGDVSVVVVTGRVAVRANSSNQSSVLTPGQAATVSATGQLLVRDSVQVSDYTGWVDGRIVFRDRTFGSVVPTLKRWYGVDIAISDSALARARFTAVLADSNLNAVLDVLAATVGARYERVDRRVVFSPK